MPLDNEDLTTPTTTEEPIVSQSAGESQDDKTSIETKGSTSGEAPAPDTVKTEETKDDEKVDDSPGIVNLRNHVKDLEKDISDLYKPTYEAVEKRGGLDVVSEGLTLWDALQEPDDGESAKQFLDNLYQISDLKYSAIVNKVFEDHGQQYLQLHGPKPEEGTKAFEWEWEKSLDEDDPVKQAISEMKAQIAALSAEKTTTVQTQSQHNLEEIKAMEDARETKYLNDRYEPLKVALDALDLGEDSDFYKTAIQASVERMFISNEDLVGKFNAAKELARKGQEKFAVGKIAEVDKAIRELTQTAISKITSTKQASVASVKTKIEENSNSLPKADNLPSTVSARETISPDNSDGKAFDRNAQLMKLRQLEATGRL